MTKQFKSWQLRFALPVCAALWLLAYALWLSSSPDKSSPPWNRFFFDLAWQIQLPLVTVILTNKWSSQGLEQFVDYGSPSLRNLAFLGPWLVLTQVLMGALLRQGLWGPTPHIVGAIFTGGFLLYFSTGVTTPAPKGHPARALAMILLWLSLAQVMLGMAAYVVKFSTGLPATMLYSTLHILSGTATLAVTAALSIILKRTARTQEVPGSPAARAV